MLKSAMAAIVAAALTLSQAAGAQTTKAVRLPFNIPRQPLSDALVVFGRQAGLQVLKREGEPAGQDVAAPEIRGELSAEEALRKLLAPSGLRYEFIDEHTVRISAAGGEPSNSNFSLEAYPGHPSSADAEANPAGKSLWDRFLVAQADQRLSNTTSASKENGEQASQQTPVRLEEILVTAQKKGDERLQDVPIPISVINPQQLTQNNQILLRDYVDTVPGLNLTPGIQNAQTPSIRGIGLSGGGANPSVALMVDDIPFGGTTGWTGDVVPDIDPGDLARIEVLRGPQGTLYGAASMGGLIRFVTIDPSPAMASGRVEAGTSGVTHGAEPGFNFRASGNVPVTDTLAFRISGYERQDPGYIDNPSLNIKGINEAQAYGGHFAALWQPSRDFSLKISALYQDIRGDAPSEVNTGPGLGSWDQNYIAGAGKYDKAIQAYSAVIKAKLGSIDLTSLTGYNSVRGTDALDFTFALPQTEPVFGVAGSLIRTKHTTDKFTQELRLSDTLWQRIDWMVGGFYTHEAGDVIQNITATDPVRGKDVGDFLYNPFYTTYVESAGFVNGTYRFNERFDLQLGGRESQISQSFAEFQTGLASYPYPAGPLPYIIPERHFSSNAFTYSVTPQFRFSSQLMAYARAASGYRAGGSNNASQGIPSQYYPDKSESYEIGIKGDLIGQLLSIDAAVYRVKWKDIQVSLSDPQTFTGYISNAGEAQSQGVELSIQSKPLAGLLLSAWVDYDDAVMTQAFPNASSLDPAANVGDRLPYVSRFSARFAAEQSFEIADDLSGFAGGAISYVGDRQGIFGYVSAPARQDLPGYAKLDLHVGIRRDSWTVNLFANNVTDRRGLLTGGLDYFPSTAFVYIQPRTVGMNVVRSW